MHNIINGSRVEEYAEKSARDVWVWGLNCFSVLMSALRQKVLPLLSSSWQEELRVESA